MDKIEGGDDDDFIQGGPGDDLLAGGEGGDTFFYNQEDVHGKDLILDFDSLDRIVLSDDLFKNINKNCLPGWHLTCGENDQWKLWFDQSDLEICFDSKPELTDDHFKIEHDHGSDLAA